MPDITPVKKLPDGFTFEGINQYGLPIYFYNGKPTLPNTASMPNYNTPVNFANRPMPTPPLLPAQPPAGQGSNTGPPNAVAAGPIFIVNWVEFIQGTGNGFGGPPATAPTPATPLPPSVPPPPPAGYTGPPSFWAQAWAVVNGGVDAVIAIPGFFGPLIPGYDYPDAGGHVGA